ncbi:MAG: hypothetical protein H0V82_07845 [Candidatus Protochlamydia sp.]|nr:hypothetical protein [Candidatus Protochlamydia sp.]
MELSNILKNSENFSFTRDLTEGLSKINKSDYKIAGPICSRILAAFTVPFVSLTDAAIHTGLCAGKALTGIFVSPYNCLAKAFYPAYIAPEGFELSSSLIHLMRAVENIFNAAILTLLCMLYPDRGNAWINERHQSSLLTAMHSERLNQAVAPIGPQGSTFQAQLEQKIIGLENSVMAHQLKNEKMKQRKIDLLKMAQKNNKFRETLAGINLQMTALRVQINDAENERIRINQEKTVIQNELQQTNQRLVTVEQMLALNKEEFFEHQIKIEELESNLKEKIEELKKAEESIIGYCDLIEKENEGVKNLEKNEIEIINLKEAIERLKIKNADNEKARIELTALNRSLLDKIENYHIQDGILSKEKSAALEAAIQRTDTIETLKNSHTVLHENIQAEVKANNQAEVKDKTTLADSFVFL